MQTTLIAEYYHLTREAKWLWLLVTATIYEIIVGISSESQSETGDKSTFSNPF